MHTSGEGQPAAPQPRPRWHRPGRRGLLLWLALTVAVLYALGVNSHWRFQRDSAVYLDLARSLVEGRGYVHNYEPHAFYPPGFPAGLVHADKRLILIIRLRIDIQHIFHLPHELGVCLGRYAPLPGEPGL